MNQITSWIEQWIGIGPATQEKLLYSIVALLIIWIIRAIAVKAAFRRSDDPRARYSWQKTSGYVAVIITFLIVGRIWISGLQSLVTYLGLVSAGIAIALRDPIINIFAWLFIIWRKPFELGDRIQIGRHAGDVIDQRVFQFTLAEIGNWVDADQSTGRIIHIPNGKIFTEMQANYSKGFQYIWNEIPVLITFESDWKKAKEILIGIAQKHSEHLSKSAQERVKAAARRYLIIYKALTPTVYTSVKESGVMLTIRYLCEPRKRRGSSQDIWEDVLEEFAGHDNIALAYPTTRIYSRFYEDGEGKEKEEE